MLAEKEIIFAKTCLENGIRTLDSSANRERSKLIAKQKGIDGYEDINALQHIIDSYIEEMNESQRVKKIERDREQKNAELHKKEELEKYSEAFGREKTIRFLDSLIAETQYTIDKREAAVKSANDIKNTYAALGMSLEPVKSPKEQDWAIAGGIASAIAGPAAGIAVAADIQRKNAEAKIDPAEAAKEAQKLRESWKTTGDSLAQTVMKNSGVSPEAYRDATRLKAELTKQKEKCEVLLVDESNDKYQLLGMLAPTTETITISETGSVHITVHIVGKKYCIFDNVPAVIDGSFKALLWNEKGECCGTAALVLPIYGVEDSSLLEAWFTTPSSKDTSYYVEFTKPNLWLVESIEKKGIQACSKIEPTENLFQKEAEQYYNAYYLMNSSEDIEKIKEAKTIFASLGNWKDACKQQERCAIIIRKLEEREQLKEEQKRQVMLQEAEKQKQKQLIRKRNKRRLVLAVVTVGVCIVSVILAKQIIIPEMERAREYDYAMELFSEKEYDKAIERLAELGDYKDSKVQINVVQKAKDEEYYQQAEKLLLEGKYTDALIIYKDRNDYLDASEKMGICINSILDKSTLAAEEKAVLSSVPDDYYTLHKEYAYMFGQALLNTSEWSLAEKYFALCDEYESAPQYVKYSKAKEAINDGNIENAITLLNTISGFIDSDNKISELYYRKVVSTDSLSLEEARTMLMKAPALDKKGQTLLNTCDDLIKCIGKYDCYQKMLKDGTMTTRDIRYSITLDYYLKEGTIYLHVDNSLFHDTKIYDAPVQLGTEGYDYIARCPSGSKMSNRQTGTEVFWFSEVEAKYAGSSFSNVYYYRKK